MRICYCESSILISSYLKSIRARTICACNNTVFNFVNCVCDHVSICILVKIFPSIRPLITFVEGNCFALSLIANLKLNFYACRSDSVLIVRIIPSLCYLYFSLFWSMRICYCEAIRNTSFYLDGISTRSICACNNVIFDFVNGICDFASFCKLIETCPSICPLIACIESNRITLSLFASHELNFYA